MIGVIATNTVKQEHLAEYQRLTGELAECSRKEDGCVFYISVQDPENPCTHIFMEQWRDEAALATHTQSEHYTRLVPQVRPLVEHATTVKKYKVVG